MYNLHPSLWSSHSSYSSLILSNSEESLARAYDWSVSEHVGICWILTLLLGAVYGSTLELYFRDSCWHFYRCNVFWNQFAARMKNYKKAYSSIVPPQQRNPSRSPSLFLLRSCLDFFSQFQCFCFYLKLHFTTTPPTPVKLWQKIWISEDDNCLFFFFLFLMGRREWAILKTSGLRNCRSCSLLKIPTDQGGRVNFSRCLLMERGVDIVESLSSVHLSSNSDERVKSRAISGFGCFWWLFFFGGGGGEWSIYWVSVLVHSLVSCLMKESSIFKLLLLSWPYGKYK